MIIGYNISLRLWNGGRNMSLIFCILGYLVVVNPTLRVLVLTIFVIHWGLGTCHSVLNYWSRNLIFLGGLCELIHFPLFIGCLPFYVELVDFHVLINSTVLFWNQPTLNEKKNELRQLSNIVFGPQGNKGATLRIRYNLLMWPIC